MYGGKYEHSYSKRDVEKAYNMGLENAIVVLEKSLGLSTDGQRRMLEALKEMVEKNKVEDIMNSP